MISLRLTGSLYKVKQITVSKALKLIVRDTTVTQDTSNGTRMKCGYWRVLWNGCFVYFERTWPSNFSRVVEIEAQALLVSWFPFGYKWMYRKCNGTTHVDCLYSDYWFTTVVWPGSYCRRPQLLYGSISADVAFTVALSKPVRVIYNIIRVIYSERRRALSFNHSFSLPIIIIPGGAQCGAHFARMCSIHL